MKRTCYQKNTNTDEQSRWLSGTCEFHPDEILLEEQHFDPKEIQQIKSSGRMKKILATCILLFCLISIGYSQNYHTGIGLRTGYSNGLTIKHFVGSNSAFEWIFASRWKGLEITGLYEVHHQAFETQRLNFYYGFGGHVGFWNGDNTNWGTKGVNYSVVGIDGILGLEYSFVEIPFNISVDWKPAYNIIGYTGFWYDGGALSIRYIF